MNRTCDHCGAELRSDAAYLNYCNDACRQPYHDKLTRTFDPTHARPRAEPGQQPRPPGVAAVLADRAAGNRAASVREAETALASQRSSQDTARLFAAQEAAMISKLALGRPRRRDLTSR